MFHPNSSHLPARGDIVCCRPTSAPATVEGTNTDRYGNVWVQLQGHNDPVRVECLNWYPRRGDRIEILMCQYIRWLDEMINEFQFWANVEPVRYRHWADKIERTRLRQQRKGTLYRVGTVTAMDANMAQVQLTNEAEVMPIECIAVVERVTNTKQLSLNILQNSETA